MQRPPLVTPPLLEEAAAALWHAAADADFINSDWDVVRFADGQTSARVYVPLVDDGIRERQEGLYLELGRPGGGAVLGGVTRSRVMRSRSRPRISNWNPWKLRTCPTSGI